MNFTSFHFVGFFTVTIILGHLLKNRIQRIFLLLASYYFYGVFEPWYLVLIISSTLIDYFAGMGIEAGRLSREGSIDKARYPALSFFGPKIWLFISIAMNLSLLGYFKYTNFGIEVFNDLQPYGDTMFAWPATYILLPIGISFYTFQSMSYTIDVYRGVLTPRKDIVDFALYVAFFPQLVAGPIVRATTFLSQLDERLSIRKNDIIVGVTRIVVGFFRKLVLADNMGMVVNTVFANPERYGPVDIWLAGIGFAFQIYLDFAGYTDIARGVARLFGFEFEINFLYPMSARNIIDHWNRWHLSLTTWIRDYVFIPLGGSRVGHIKLYFNVFFIWFLTGIWHGPAYHFVVWGLWQAVMITIYRLYKNTRLHDVLNDKGGFVYDVLARITTMFFLTFGFIWFRAETMTKATFMQGRLFALHDLPRALTSFKAFLFNDGTWAAVKLHLFGPATNGTGTVTPVLKSFLVPVHTDYLVLLFLYFIYEYIFKRLQLEYFWKPKNKRKLICLMIFMIFCIIVFASPDTPNFMYFQF